MNSIMKDIFELIFRFVISISLTFFFIDMVEFNNILKSGYKTPFYTTNWFKSPYTNFKLIGEPVAEHWTQNATKSEDWLVREVKYDDKVFWTILKRVEKNSCGK